MTYVRDRAWRPGGHYRRLGIHRIRRGEGGLAAVYRFWARDPRMFYEVNVGGTLNVLSAVRAAGCERLVFTSTAGVLGLAMAPDGGPSDADLPAQAR